MRSKVKALDLVGVFKFSVTTFFLLDFIFRVFESAISFNSNQFLITTSLVSLFALIGLKNEFQSVQLNNKALAKRFSARDEIKVIVTYTFASIATYVITVLFDINMTLSASLIVLSMVFLIRKPFPSFQATVYTGTFTGMVSNQFISNWLLALLFGLVGSLFYLYFQPSYRATGGRAGLNAYMTSFLFIFLFSDVNYFQGEPLANEMILLGLVFLIGGAFIAYLLKENTRISGVQAGMLVTLVLNLLIPNKWSVLITAGFMGSFMGTTSSERVKNLPFLFLIEFFAFLLLIPAYPLLGGLGGKLGMVTLIGYMAADGITTLIEYFKKTIFF